MGYYDWGLDLNLTGGGVVKYTHFMIPSGVWRDGDKVPRGINATGLCRETILVIRMNLFLSMMPGLFPFFLPSFLAVEFY